MKPMVTKSGAACGAEIACDLAQDIDEATFREIERFSRQHCRRLSPTKLV
jgi:hypothetical protein